jgi:hypothetical protein
MSITAKAGIQPSKETLGSCLRRSTTLGKPKDFRPTPGQLPTLTVFRGASPFSTAFTGSIKDSVTKLERGRGERTIPLS